jgi:hypothetical protein
VLRGEVTTPDFPVVSLRFFGKRQSLIMFGHLICLRPGFLIRLYSVLKYESVIHEFDPYFNFRATKYLASEGFYDFLNWFDDRAWYPLGRIVGGTLYPGLPWCHRMFSLWFSPFTTSCCPRLDGRCCTDLQLLSLDWSSPGHPERVRVLCTGNVGSHSFVHVLPDAGSGYFGSICLIRSHLCREPPCLFR